MKKSIIFNLLLLSLLRAVAQPADVKLGAYYFDGWSTMADKMHLTKSLVDSFPMRKPVWGWVTTTPAIMDAQINTAADAGLSFFSFCWFYSARPGTDSLNKAMRLFNGSPYKNRMKYCLLVANHTGFSIGPDEWPIVTNKWVNLFKTGSYLTVNGKPLIIFLSVKSLLDQFGSAEKVRQAFNILRQKANENGLSGVSIAACLGPGKNETSVAEECGFDVLTGYNYSPIGFVQGQKQIPIENLQKPEVKIWDKFHTVSNLPCIPLVTLNWDPRPWSKGSKYYAEAPSYTGYSAESVYNSVKHVVNWVNNHPQYVTREKLAILYAWNEYGEGAWLTPSANDRLKLLSGVTRALRE